MRKILLIGVVLAALAVATECISAYILYVHYDRSGRMFRPHGLATLQVIDRLFFARQVSISAKGGKPFRLDSLLGFGLRPGSYRITEFQPQDLLQLDFALTVDSDGHRAVSPQRRVSSKRVLLAGDSSFLGWGVNDETTLGWLLQTRLPACQFINMSLSSYSYVQALLQLQKLEPAVTKSDVIILPYHPITNEFNAGMRSVLKPLLNGTEVQLGSTNLVNMQYPYGTLDASGKLEIKRTPLPLPGQVMTTPESLTADAPLARRITIGAIEKIRSEFPAHLYIAIQRIDGTDPVFEYIKQQGIDYIDLRLDAETADDSDLVNGHPGPMWHHDASTRIAQQLSERHLCE